MKKYIIPLLFAVTTLGVQAQNKPQNLDQLLQKVQSDRKSEKAWLAKREQEFLGDKNQRANLLNKAKAELAAVEAITKRLQATYEANEKKLSKLEGELNIAVGTLGELFGVVKQVSGDFRAQVQNSIVSAQIKEREPFLAKLSEAKELPSISDLERLWFELQREMTESQKVVTFKASVVEPSGEKHDAEVTRVGAFNLTSEGEFVTYQFETDQIIKLSRQPPGHYLSTIKDLQSAAAGEMVQFSIDPSRGTLLSILVTSPSLQERVSQGGIVGYVIILLTLLGIGIVIERYIALKKQEKILKAQLESSEIDTHNPIGQLMAAFNKYKNTDVETLQSKMDEIIIKYLPTVERGIGSVKIFASIGPLLGLLGTVTGMIGTFQSITLFGTGDPKLMAGGISMALITTVQGLTCAIPLILLHTFISGKSKGIVQLLEEQSAGLIASKTEGDHA